MNEAEERKAFEEWASTAGFDRGYVLGWAAWQARAALAQPEPAPGWCKHCRQYTIEEPLLAAPTVVEPVAWLHEDGFKAITDDEKDGWIQSGRSGVVSGYTVPLYATPPRAALTDAQLLDILFARAIEAAHGIGKAVTP
jgi:hypothetical protein